VWRQLRALVPLPGMAALVVPGLILWRSGELNPGWGLGSLAAALPVLLGVALIGLGLTLFVATVRLFARIGKGTLAPWDPPTRLVIAGPYRYFRHPMITGVACVLLGEAALLGSRGILTWAGIFVAVNAVYLPLVEEPRLRRRFGSDYEAYTQQVPRWVPLRPWSARR
jgi:protein-S-isoprenylcysteine O-methyltransferase Ste14